MTGRPITDYLMRTKAGTTDAGLIKT